MEIRTKFNVGDMVWRIFSYNNEFWQVEKRAVAINCISIEYKKTLSLLSIYFYCLITKLLLNKNVLPPKKKHKRSVREEMGNKILVEFDEREFYKGCMYCSNFEAGWCEQTNRDVLKCALEHKVDFKIYETDEYVNKIKEQNNGNKGTED